MHILALLLFSIVRYSIKSKTRRFPWRHPRRTEKKKCMGMPGFNEPLVLSRNSLIPTDHVNIGLRRILLSYLHTTIVIVIQSGLYSNSFSGILLRVGNDYIELLKLQYMHTSTKTIQKQYRVDIPINKITAVCLPFI